MPEKVVLSLEIDGREPSIWKYELSVNDDDCKIYYDDLIKDQIVINNSRRKAIKDTKSDNQEKGAEKVEVNGRTGDAIQNIQQEKRKDDFPVRKKIRVSKEETLSTLKIQIVDEQRHKIYEKIYKRSLNSKEATIIDSWHRIVGKNEYFYVYPEISKETIHNAFKSYACDAKPEEIIIALSERFWKKKGCLYTTLGMYWNPDIFCKNRAVLYSSLNSYKYSDQDSLTPDLGTFGTRKIFKEISCFINEAIIITNM